MGSMTKYLCVLILMTVTSMTPVIAHDIGITQTELLEQENHHYKLSAQIGAALSYLYPPPGLPDHCQFVGNPRGTQGAGGKTFEFQCDGGLTATDTLELTWQRDGVVLTVHWLDGSKAKRLFRSEAGAISVPLIELQAGSGSWFEGAKRYTALGIEHILLGIDHLLFVLALLLLVRGTWMLVKTITAFTIAHSITLGLATLGFVHVPPLPVEAAIALSIVFLCAEIIHAQRGQVRLTFQYPWVVAFAFGLLHGLGFAGALAEIGLPQSEIPLALLFFNIGVEIGQLIFVAVVLFLVWSFRQISIDASRLARSFSVYVIGTLATFWLLQRTALIFAS